AGVIAIRPRRRVARVHPGEKPDVPEQSAEPHNVGRASGRLTPELRSQRAICHLPTKYGFLRRGCYRRPLGVSCLPSNSCSETHQVPSLFLLSLPALAFGAPSALQACTA